jgi:acyl-CoA oxidase
MPANPDWVKALKPATDGAALLASERSKSDLPVSRVTTFLFGEEFLETRRKILEQLEKEKVFDKAQNYYAGRIQRFENALARAKRLRLLATEHDWSLEDHNIAVDLLGEPIPYMLHGTMFLVSSGHIHGNKRYTNGITYSSRSSTNRTKSKAQNTS